MSTNPYSIHGAELVSLKIAVAKNGNAYASGILNVRDVNGKFEASHRFLSFDAVDAFRSLELQYFSKQSAQPDTSGGDLAFADGEPDSTETRERTISKEIIRIRPAIDVSGWFKTSKMGTAWVTSYMVEAVHH
jgi:hypothetical protein